MVPAAPLQPYSGGRSTCRTSAAIPATYRCSSTSRPVPPRRSAADRAAARLRPDRARFAADAGWTDLADRLGIAVGPAGAVGGEQPRPLLQLVPARRTSSAASVRHCRSSRWSRKPSALPSDPPRVLSPDCPPAGQWPLHCWRPIPTYLPVEQSSLVCRLARQVPPRRWHAWRTRVPLAGTPGPRGPRRRSGWYAGPWPCVSIWHGQRTMWWTPRTPALAEQWSVLQGFDSSTQRVAAAKSGVGQHARRSSFGYCRHCLMSGRPARRAYRPLLGSAGGLTATPCNHPATYRSRYEMLSLRWLVHAELNFPRDLDTASFQRIAGILV